MADTVPMVRIDDGKTADVHPAEVENWQATGWALVPRPAETKDAPAKPVKRRKG